ncbi:hypothetical protein CEP53_013446 [Fusarium sp. AF-6]|nr:hypothetical protein CEP53_013446 [Fusarium sp. AF-6]
MLHHQHAGHYRDKSAVSYFEIPSATKDPDALDSLGDTIPAGWGMQDVQILVISREDNTKICPVGEQGEIYFRAAGLAEGYLGDPQKTAEKFIDNWLVDNAKWVEADKANDKGEPWRIYYKGPRDRLYRAGDFVAYLKRFWRMQAEVRDHLKSRLSTHLVPSIYIMLQKLPLSPNGKVDFPNLPFPDATARTEDASGEDLKNWEALSQTERTLATQWSTLIPGLNAKTIRPKSNVFDCSEHSLLAHQLLLNIPKSLGANITTGVLYANSSLRGLGSQVDRLRSGQAATVDKAVDTAYAESFEELIKTLDDKYQSADPDALSPSSGATFFLTGATGFLGAYYLVKEILGRKNTKPIAYIRGAKGLYFAKDRLTRSLNGYSLWQDSWAERIECVLGDLSKPRLGLDDASWRHIAQYGQMMRPDVLSTIDAMKFCNEGKPKLFSFVLSTSTLDTDYYFKLSHEQTATGRGAVLQADDMQGSRVGLDTGYGQTKWVSEQLVREAGRGLRGAVVRPGYILGSRENGVSNTDDFLTRLCKGCFQLGARPLIIISVNAVPVDHVARVVIASALNPLPGVNMVHVTAHPRLRMKEFLSALEYYGYKVPEVDHEEWKTQLEEFVSAGSTEKD